jgi:hypothetical protein
MLNAQQFWQSQFLRHLPVAMAGLPIQNDRFDLHLLADNLWIIGLAQDAFYPATD